MIVTSGILIYTISYLNTYRLDHIYFSEMRLYMMILSTCVMTIRMLLFTLEIVKNKEANKSIILVSILIFTSSCLLMIRKVRVR